MAIERKHKPVLKPSGWTLCTEEMAQIHADVTEEYPDGIRLISDGWFWSKNDLNELKDFIDILIEEGPWN